MAEAILVAWAALGPGSGCFHSGQMLVLDGTEEALLKFYGSSHLKRL